MHQQIQISCKNIVFELVEAQLIQHFQISMTHRRNVVPQPRRTNAAQRDATQLYDRLQEMIVDLSKG